MPHPPRLDTPFEAPQFNASKEFFAIFEETASPHHSQKHNYDFAERIFFGRHGGTCFANFETFKAAYRNYRVKARKK